MGRDTYTRALSAVAVAFATLAFQGCQSSNAQANALTGGDADRGKVAIRKYGCGSCHSIPGIPGATATVGPNLSGIGSRSYVAGVISNSPENMMRWIINPQAVDDKTAMPKLGVTAHDARDIAAYLYTLR